MDGMMDGTDGMGYHDGMRMAWDGMPSMPSRTLWQVSKVRQLTCFMQLHSFPQHHYIMNANSGNQPYLSAPAMLENLRLDSSVKMSTESSKILSMCHTCQLHQPT